MRSLVSAVLFRHRVCNLPAQPRILVASQVNQGESSPKSGRLVRPADGEAPWTDFPKSGRLVCRTARLAYAAAAILALPTLDRVQVIATPALVAMEAAAPAAAPPGGDAPGDQAARGSRGVGVLGVLA